MNTNDFLKWVLTLIPSQFRDTIKIIHNNTSAILLVFNSSRQIDTAKLKTLCKYSYEFIVTELPWVNITPSLLAHCEELIESCNDGYGMKEYLEEALEACNKLVTRYRENISRKCSFASNSTVIHTPPDQW